MAMKAPNANANEYSPVKAGPSSREINKKSTRLEKSAANRQTDSQNAFLITIIHANTFEEANTPVRRIRGKLYRLEERSEADGTATAKTAPTATNSASNQDSGRDMHVSFGKLQAMVTFNA